MLYSQATSADKERNAKDRERETERETDKCHNS